MDRICDIGLFLLDGTGDSGLAIVATRYVFNAFNCSYFFWEFEWTQLYFSLPAFFLKGVLKSHLIFAARTDNANQGSTICLHIIVGSNSKR